MKFFTCTIVVQVDTKSWSEQNDRDLDCMRAVMEYLEDVDGADEVPWNECRPSTTKEITQWRQHQEMLERKKPKNPCDCGRGFWEECNGDCEI